MDSIYLKNVIIITDTQTDNLYDHISDTVTQAGAYVYQAYPNNSFEENGIISIINGDASDPEYIPVIKGELPNIAFVSPNGEVMGVLSKKEINLLNVVKIANGLVNVTQAENGDIINEKGETVGNTKANGIIDLLKVDLPNPLAFLNDYLAQFLGSLTPYFYLGTAIISTYKTVDSNKKTTKGIAAAVGAYSWYKYFRTKG